MSKLQEKTQTGWSFISNALGFSGPAILKLSAWGAKELAEVEYKFSTLINWCGETTENEVREQWISQKSFILKK
jgi:predicted flavoprotein YhiN